MRNIAKETKMFMGLVFLVEAMLIVSVLGFHETYAPLLVLMILVLLIFWYVSFRIKEDIIDSRIGIVKEAVK